MSQSSKASIWRCGGNALLSFECPMNWEALDETNDPNIRLCQKCRSKVFFCDTPDEFAAHAKARNCVALPSALDIPNDAMTSKQMLGRPAPWSFELNEKAKIFWMGLKQQFEELELQLTKELDIRPLAILRREAVYDVKSLSNDGERVEKMPVEDEFNRISFAEITSEVPKAPGIYEIWTKSEIPLKVGISKDLRKRLKQHAASRDSGLKVEKGLDGIPTDPAHITSKGSILAKHLFFDRALAGNEYDLTTEAERQKYLQDKCYIRFLVTATRDEARRLEKTLEKSGKFRYARIVQKIKNL